MRRTKHIVVTLEQEDIYRGPLVLVNASAPVWQDIPAQDLAEVAPGVLLEKQTALLYSRIIHSIGAVGRILPVSGHRSHAQQQLIYTQALQGHGAEYAATYVALPGCSEHQTGLAIDVAQAAEHIDFIAPAFPYSGICQLFRQAAVAHGFVQRYLQGKQPVTGIGHEPWHFRYVGIPHAQLMTERGLVLEEYLQWIKDYPLAIRPFHYQAGGRSFEIGYVPAGPGQTEIPLRGEPYTLSGNNIDGFIAAVWGDAP